MDDQELASIRAAQLKSGGSDQNGQPGGSDEDAQRQAAQRQTEAEMKRDMLATVLDSGARERLARISLVRPTLAEKVQTMLLRMAQSGQLRSRVTEQQLIGLLENADGAQAAASAKKSTIVYSRRKVDEDDDFDFDI